MTASFKAHKTVWDALAISWTHPATPFQARRAKVKSTVTPTFIQASNQHPQAVPIANVQPDVVREYTKEQIRALHCKQFGMYTGKDVNGFVLKIFGQNKIIIVAYKDLRCLSWESTLRSLLRWHFMEGAKQFLFATITTSHSVGLCSLCLVGFLWSLLPFVLFLSHCPNCFVAPSKLPWKPKSRMELWSVV